MLRVYYLFKKRKLQCFNGRKRKEMMITKALCHHRDLNPGLNFSQQTMQLTVGYSWN